MRRPDPSIRIAITGAGILCSIGRNQSEVWESIVAARDGISKFTRFPDETFPTDIAAEAQFELPLPGREAKRLSRTDLMAVIAAKEALARRATSLASACWFRSGRRPATAGRGGLLFPPTRFRTQARTGVARGATADVRSVRRVARVLGLGGGAVSNATACASAGAAIGMAADSIRSGYADAALAGGSDALCG